MDTNWHVISSTVGNVSENSDPKYEFLSMPSFTDMPFGHERSIITRLCDASAFSRVMKGDTCVF